MYLEETIEALEVQEDSGLSNDEQDLVPGHEKRRQMRAEGRRISRYFLFSIGWWHV